MPPAGSNRLGHTTGVWRGDMAPTEWMTPVIYSLCCWC
jgi:hypothetical protein